MREYLANCNLRMRFNYMSVIMQAHLGVKDARAAEEALDQATWVAEACALEVTHVMRSQLSRLLGHLRTLQGRCDVVTAAPLFPFL